MILHCKTVLSFFLLISFLYSTLDLILYFFIHFSNSVQIPIKTGHETKNINIETKIESLRIFVCFQLPVRVTVLRGTQKYTHQICTGRAVFISFLLSILFFPVSNIVSAPLPVSCSHTCRQPHMPRTKRKRRTGFYQFSTASFPLRRMPMTLSVSLLSPRPPWKMIRFPFCIRHTIFLGASRAFWIASSNHIGPISN